MKSAEVVRLVAAFVGGGIGKALLDHYFSGRRDRRARLTPKDHERIATVRAVAQALHAAARKGGAKARLGRDGVMPPLDLMDGHVSVEEDDAQAADLAVRSLDDPPLSDAWFAFSALAQIHPFSIATADSDQEVMSISSRFEGLYDRVMKRLNHLERKR